MFTKGCFYQIETHDGIYQRAECVMSGSKAIVVRYYGANGVKTDSIQHADIVSSRSYVK